MTIKRINKIWRKAMFLYENTPSTRNRFVDFLRVFSVFSVVLGHWLIVTGVYKKSGFLSTDLLSFRPETSWLTWILQVMPVFFIVGGYSNSVSWKAYQKEERKFEDWLSDRLRRLIWPTFPLVTLWVIFIYMSRTFSLDPYLLESGANFALQPVWFLAVYLVIIIFTPIAIKFWHKAGIWSFWVMVAAGIAVDVLRRGFGYENIAWLNYIFIWLALHQLGIAWQFGWFQEQWKRAVFAIAGFVILVLLVKYDLYPYSMVNIPGEKFGNLFPPNFTMIALGAFQGGGLLLLEDRVNNWLQNVKAWAAIVLLNGMGMTIFLWHVTVNILVMNIAFKMGGVGLKMDIGGLEWWLAKFIWIPVLFFALIPFLLIFSRFENIKYDKESKPYNLFGVFFRIILVCSGLGMIALKGITGDGPYGMNYWALLLTFFSYIFIHPNLKIKRK